MLKISMSFFFFLLASERHESWMLIIYLMKEESPSIMAKNVKKKKKNLLFKQKESKKSSDLKAVQKKHYKGKKWACLFLLFSCLEAPNETIDLILNNWCQSSLVIYYLIDTRWRSLTRRRVGMFSWAPWSFFGRGQGPRPRYILFIY